MAKRAWGFLLFIIPFICCSTQGIAKNSIKVSVRYEGGLPNNILVEGKLDTKMWLGVSLYSPTVKDALKEGNHIVREIKPGSFMEICLVDNAYSGSYEVALWKKKVECEGDTTYWCKKYGFYLDSLAFYHAGYFNSIKEK